VDVVSLLSLLFCHFGPMIKKKKVLPYLSSLSNSIDEPLKIPFISIDLLSVRKNVSLGDKLVIQQ